MSPTPGKVQTAIADPTMIVNVPEGGSPYVLVCAMASDMPVITQKANAAKFVRGWNGYDPLADVAGRLIASLEKEGSLGHESALLMAETLQILANP